MKITFMSHDFEFEKDDILVLYTDGIIEAKNASGVEFGYERLKKTLKKLHSSAAMEIQKQIMNKFIRFVGQNSMPDDDFSLLVIKFKL
jgi:phosphoserine phosphatase RsbU/P